MAKKTGIGKTTVNRILQELGLHPHKVSKRNYSNDPKFEEEVRYRQLFWQNLGIQMFMILAVLLTGRMIQ